MTHTSRADVLEIEEHIVARWPNTKPWSDDTRRAWFSELRKFDPVDVWTVVHNQTGTFPPGVMEVVEQVRTRLRADRPTVRQLPGARVVGMDVWLEAHDFSGLAAGLRGGHPDDCAVCTELGIPPVSKIRAAAPRCDGGGDHVWGSVDCLDLADDGWLTVWCAVCFGEKRVRPFSGRGAA